MSVAVLAALFCYTRARAGAPAGAIIANQASVTFMQPGGADTTASNTVVTQVLSTYLLRVSPPGTPASPAFDLTGNPGDTLVCRFTIDNLGNARDSVAVTPSALPSATLSGVIVIPFLDANGNGRLDAGEDDPAFLAVAAGASTPVDIALVLPVSPLGWRTWKFARPPRSIRIAAAHPRGCSRRPATRLSCA